MGVATETEIANMGLAMVGGDQITDIGATPDSEDPTELVLARLFFDSARDTVLESANWPFAMVRDYLDTYDGTDPDGSQYSRRFAVPADCLRVVQLSLTGSFKDEFDWEVEGQYILVTSDAIYIRYIRQVITTTEFTNSFVHALAAYLALVFCMPLTQNEKWFSKLQTQYSGMLELAVRSSSQQGKGKSTTTNSALINAR